MKFTANACLALDRISMFVKNELTELERLQVEKHCALCAPCREQLVEILRTLLFPLVSNQQQKFPYHV